MGVRNSSMVQALINPSMSGLPEHMERHGADFNKIYCQRAIIQHTDCLNTSVLDCSVTFMVDKNICLLGVQVIYLSPKYFCCVFSGDSVKFKIRRIFLLSFVNSR